jgi:hypothetical protein
MMTTSMTCYHMHKDHIHDMLSHAWLGWCHIVSCTQLNWCHVVTCMTRSMACHHMHYNGICDNCRFQVIVKHDDMHWFQMHEKVKIQVNGK